MGEGTIGKSVSNVRVRVGSKKHSEGGELHKISQLLSHFSYNPTNMDYDVAVAKLSVSIELDGTLKRAIALPKTSDDIADGIETFISGWGKTSYASTTPSANLRGATIRTMNLEECVWNYKNVVSITVRMVCAAAPGIDACQVSLLFHQFNAVKVFEKHDRSYKLAYSNFFKNLLKFSRALNVR